MRKLPNGYGGVAKLPGRRTHPYRARITEGWVYRDNAPPLQRFFTLGYYRTREDAMEALMQFRRQPFKTELASMTFRQAYDGWTKHYFLRCPGCRRITESVMQHLKPIWNKPVRSLRTCDLQRIFDGLPELSHGYHTKIRSVMHRVLDWCIRQDILTRDCSLYVELPVAPEPEEKQIFTPADVRRICALAAGDAPLPGEPVSYERLNLRRTLPVLFYTGLRVGELLSLKKTDVHLPERFIRVDGTKTKAAKRLVPIHQALLPFLEAQLATPGPYLFGDGNTKLTYSRYKYSWFESVMEALELRHNPHETRHTFISRMDTCGIPRTVQRFIVGHADRSVTAVYTHKDVPELLAAITRLTYDEEP